MYLQSVVIFCLALVQTSLCHDDIHTFMSERQIREVFQTEADAVQEHEVVNLQFSERLHKRQVSVGTRMSLRAFGDDINLWLYPRDSILFGDDTPVYLARHSPNEPSEVAFTPWTGLMRQIASRLWEDPRYLASVIIGTGGINRSKRSVNGYIGSKKLAIRSVPQSVVRKYLRKRRSIDDIDDTSNYHVVYRINENDEQNHLRPAEKMIAESRISESTPPPPVPPILYPEILVFVENSIYKLYDRRIVSLLEYLLAFWNGVDLKYRVLENPRVRMHISAIVLGQDSQATPFILNNMINGTMVRPDKALFASPTFFYSIKDTFPSVSYDVAVTLMRYKMAGSVLGMAIHRGACEVSDRYNGTNKNVLVHDNGGFEGVSIAAHEIGHTFGMFDEYGDNGTLECSFKYGFVMGGFAHYTVNSSTFSQCSLNKFQETLDDQKLTCLYNVPPRLGNDVPKLMPGKVQSLAEQCKAHVNGTVGEPCKPHDVETMDICVNYGCMQNGSCTLSGESAADGTPCGDENDRKPRFCLHQRCVHL